VHGDLIATGGRPQVQLLQLKSVRRITIQSMVGVMFAMNGWMELLLLLLQMKHLLQ